MNSAITFVVMFALAAVVAAEQVQDTSSIGRLAWSKSFGSSIESSPSVYTLGEEEYIAFGNYADDIYSIDTTTHRMLWRPFHVGEMVRSSVTPFSFGPNKTALYFMGGDSKLYAVDGATGTQMWNFAAGPIGVYAVSTPALYHNSTTTLVIFGAVDDNVYALDALTGKPAWHFVTGKTIYASPCVHGDMVFIGSDDGIVYALNASTGQLKWQFQTFGMVRSGCMVWANSTGATLYIGSNDGYLYALDTLHGTLNFQFTTGGPITGIATVYKAANGTDILYFGSYDNSLYAISPVTGVQHWSLNLGDNVIASPRVAIVNSNPLVVVGDQSNLFNAVDGFSGKLMWSYRCDERIWSSAAILPGNPQLAVFGDQAGTLYALKLD